MVKFIKDENDSAKHYFKKARQRNHKNFNSHYFLGQIEIYDEKYAQALEHFDKARTIDPDHAPVFYFSSLAKYYLRRFEDALTDINKAIELRKGYADAYGIRGNIHLMMGNKNKGCEDYQKSFDLGNKQYKEAIKETCN